MASPKRLNLTYTPNSGSTIPFQSSVATPAVNVFGLASTPWQVGAAQSTTLTLSYTAWTGFQTQNFSVRLQSFPAALNLAAGTQAVIVPSVTITTPITVAAVFASPVLQIYYGNGGTLLRGLSGTPTFSPQEGGKYTNLSLAGSLTAYAPSAVAATTVSINVSVVLLGLTL